MKRLSRNDLLLLGALFSCSFLPLCLFGWNENPVPTAVLSVDGEELRSIPLGTHKGRESFPIETSEGANTVTIDGQTIAVTDADCPDKICVKTGAIQKKGEAIACLPHKLVIEIK